MRWNLGHYSMVNVETLGYGWIVKIQILISEWRLEYEFGSLLLNDTLDLLIVGIWICLVLCRFKGIWLGDFKRLLQGCNYRFYAYVNRLYVINCWFIYICFVLTRWVYIGLFIILMSLEGVRIIHRCPIGVSTVIDPHFRHNKCSIFWDITTCNALLPGSCLFLVWLIFPLWRLRRNVPLNRRFIFNGL
jgi:hypothetical protein